MITRLTNENVLITNHRSNSKYFYHYDWKKTTDISVINRDIENVYAILDDENSCLDIRQNLEKQGKKVTLITSDEFEKKVDGMLDAIEVSKKEIVVVYGLPCRTHLFRCRLWLLYLEDYHQIFAKMWR